MNEGGKDKFGGWKAWSLEASGWFRAAQARDRWWLVTPEGHPYLSFGVNHCGPGILFQPYNREHWAKEARAEIDSSIEWRAGLGTALADWPPVLPKERNPHFPSWWEGKIRKDFDAFGFDSFGCHSPLSWLVPGFSYVIGLRFLQISHWQEPTEGDFLDVFDDSYAKHCDRALDRLPPSTFQDPWLLGYSFSDCTIFTDLDAAERGNTTSGAKRRRLPTFPRVYRDLGPRSPGKRAYVAAMREIYRDDIQDFNKTYGTTWSRFEDLEKAEKWASPHPPRPDLEWRDNLVFLQRVVLQYYSATVAAIRRRDSNHMIFGDKLNGNTHIPDFVLNIVKEHCDVLFYQTYGVLDEQMPKLDHWSSVVGKPLLNGDSSYSVPNPQMPDPYGVHCVDQAERATRFREFAYGAFSRPDFVGWHWCGWMDRYESSQEDKQHSGIQDPWGNHYAEMVQAMKTFSNERYRIATERLSR